MICEKCGKRYSSNVSTCPYCGEKKASIPEGKAMVRVVINPNTSAMGKFGNVGAGYLVYLTIDDKEYKLSSKKGTGDKKGVHEFLITSGVHFIQAGTMSKKSAKALNVLGNITKFTGAVLGSSTAYIVGGSAEGMAGDAIDEGREMSFASGDILTLKFKANSLGFIVYDED